MCCDTVARGRPPHGAAAIATRLAVTRPRTRGTAGNEASAKCHDPRSNVCGGGVSRQPGCCRVQRRLTGGQQRPKRDETPRCGPRALAALDPPRRAWEEQVIDHRLTPLVESREVALSATVGSYLCLDAAADPKDVPRRYVARPAADGTENRGRGSTIGGPAKRPPRRDPARVTSIVAGVSPWRCKDRRRTGPQN